MDKKKEFEPGRGYSREDWDDVCDNPEWTEEDFRNARPFAEVFPELAAKIRADQEAQRASASGTKQLVWIPLDIEVAEALRATGEDWKDRVNEVLRRALALS